MQVLTVIPITRGIHIEELTYFTAKAGIVPGMVIEVPLRGKNAYGLVIESAPVAKSKAALKNADFSVRKIHSAKGAHLLSPAFMRAARRSAEYHAASLGSILFSSVPTAALLHAPDIAPKTPGSKSAKVLAADKTILVSERVRRVDHFRNLLRESFAKKRSIFIMVPSRIEAMELYSEITKGVEQYAFALTGALSAKETARRFKAIMESKHPVAIIATPPFLSIPRSDIATIIIERESAGAYVARGRPHLDYRLLAEYLSEELGIRLIMADGAVRASTYFRFETGQLAEIARTPKRMAIESKAVSIDMRQYKSERKQQPFTIFSPELITAVTDEINRGGRALLFSARRGISPITVCLDCGTTKVCPRCEAPMVLHTGSGGNIFACHQCGHTRSSEERCVICDSWRLQTLGIGTERVRDEIARLVPEAEVAVLDIDHAATEKAARTIATNFLEKPKQILVGTERALSFVRAPLSTIGIVSLDSLLSIPEWNAYERVFNLLMRLREQAEGTLYIQTRKPTATVIADAAAGNLLAFYERELRERKQFGYPPFTTLIRLDVAATRERYEYFITDAIERMAAYNPIRTPRVLGLSNGQFQASALIRIPSTLWPNADLMTALRSLPPAIKIRIDPDSVV